MRYFFETSYKGTHYHGWQVQNNAVSVQQVINESLEKILKEPIETLGSSRTDTGVHSSQQFFQLDSDTVKDLAKLKFRLNSLLPRDISIIDIRQTRPEANCRFDASLRSYEYRVTKVKNPFLFETAIELRKPLNLNRMNKAAELLMGTHDFKSFCKASQAVPGHNCTVKKAIWKEKGTELTFQITANRFLRGMVRAIVGTLLQVGDGSINVKDFQRILRLKDRKQAGPAAPAKGLCLTRVQYPSRIFISKSLNLSV